MSGLTPGFSYSKYESQESHVSSLHKDGVRHVLH